LMYKLL